MNLSIRILNGVAVTDIDGKLVGGPENSKHFRAVIERLQAAGNVNIVLNLTDVPWANSQGIGLLLDAQSKILKAGGRLVLAHLDDRVQGLLTVTRLLPFFEVCPTPEAAVASLRVASAKLSDVHAV